MYRNLLASQSFQCKHFEQGLGQNSVTGHRIRIKTVYFGQNVVILCKLKNNWVCSVNLSKQQRAISLLVVTMTKNHATLHQQ